MLALLRILLWDLPAHVWSVLVRLHRVFFVLLYPAWAALAVLIVGCALLCILLDMLLCRLFAALGVKVEEEEKVYGDVCVRESDGPGFTSLRELFEGASSLSKTEDVPGSGAQPGSGPEPEAGRANLGV